VHKTNPMLQTPVWTFADMAVAQDWELERGNECALIWTDLGPEMARVLCKNHGVIEVLTGFVEEPMSLAKANTGARVGVGTLVRVGSIVGAWAGSGSGARVRAGAWGWNHQVGSWAADRAGAGPSSLSLARARAYSGMCRY